MASAAPGDYPETPFSDSSVTTAECFDLANNCYTLTLSDPWADGWEAYSCCPATTHSLTINVNIIHSFQIWEHGIKHYQEMLIIM